MTYHQQRIHHCHHQGAAPITVHNFLNSKPLPMTSIQMTFKSVMESLTQRMVTFTFIVLLLLSPAAHAQRHPVCEISGSVSGSIVECSGKNINSLPDNLPSDTVELDLSDNLFTSFDSLADMDKLRTLKMESCHIENIPSDAFRWMSDLQTLILTGNKITDVSVDSFLYNPKLETIYLNGNQLRSMKANIFNGMKLSVLNLANNFLQALPQQAFTAASITSLILDDNQLTRIPTNVLDPIKSSLEYLDCSNNRKTLKIEDTAFKDTTLRRLTFKNSSIEDTSFVQYITSSSLDLSNNNALNMDEISQDNFARVQNLNLQNISLYTGRIASFMKNFHNVIQLDISHNELMMFPAASLSHMTSLEKIDLSHNALQIIPPDLGLYVKSLKDLNLEHNHIERITVRDLQHLGVLDNLNMDHNRIQLLNKDISPQLDRIETLNFNSNPIHCNCEMKWFREWLSTRSTYVGVNQCSSPKKVKLWTLTPEEFLCTSPNITFMTNNVTEVEGTDLFLTCVAYSDPAPEVEWRSPQGDIVSITPPQNRTKYKASAVWHLSDLNVYHTGWYTCTAKNMVTASSRSIYVSVQSNKTTTTMSTSTSTTTTVTTTPTTTTTTTTTSPTTTTTIQTCPPTVTCQPGCEIEIVGGCAVGCINCKTTTIPPPTTTTTTTETTTPTTTSTTIPTTTTTASTTTTSSQTTQDVDNVTTTIKPEGYKDNQRTIIIVAVLLGAILLIAFLIVICCILRRKKHFRKYDIEEHDYDAKHFLRKNMPPIPPSEYGNGHVSHGEKTMNGNMISSV